MGNIFHLYFVQPLFNLLVAFYKVFEVINAPGKLGLAIIAFTVFIRLVMYPLFKKQMDTTKKMQDLKPHLDLLNEKHKNDKQKLQQEQLRLYQEAGINPAAGCLLAIVQIPVFIALYNALNFFINHGVGAANLAKINKEIYFTQLKITTIDVNFLGYVLTKTPANGGEWWYYLIPLITGILQYFQAAVTMITPPSAPAKKDKDGKIIEKKPDTGEDFQKAMQTQMKYMFPVMIGFFSYSFPVALSLYWNVFSIFSIIQYYLTKEKKPKEDTKELAESTTEPKKESKKNKKK
jgi:YidC/Oxa1 family membrane protein insertase